MTVTLTASPPPESAFIWPLRVYWEDTDAGGIVFYANYLKFFERARTEWLRSLGVGQQSLRERSGGMFVVSETTLRYLRSARLDDALAIHTRLLTLGRVSIELEQSAWRAGDEAAGALCEGRIRIGWVDAASMRPARIPAQVLQVLQ